MDDLKRRITEVLSGAGVPVRWMIYSNNPDAPLPDAYITFYIMEQRAELYAEDMPQDMVTYGTADIWSRTDPSRLCRIVRSLLLQGGFIVTSMGPEMFETDTRLFHVPVEWYIEDYSEGE